MHAFPTNLTAVVGMSHGQAYRVRGLVEAVVALLDPCRGVLPDGASPAAPQRAQAAACQALESLSRYPHARAMMHEFTCIYKYDEGMMHEFVCI